MKKKNQFTKEIQELLEFHYNNSLEYRRILDGFFGGLNPEKDIEELPFIPVRLFKSLNLKSVKDKEVVKTMTSSGTSGQGFSKIFLDKETVRLQQKALISIFKNQTDYSRLPMLIIDTPSTVQNRITFNARAAGILGFSMFGSKREFALNDDLTLNWEMVAQFFKRNENKPFLLFGFTYIVYRNFLRYFEKKGIEISDNQGILIHGGGWKKLEEEAISSEEFKSRIKNVLGVNRIYDYYGMIEQTGSIFFECECGYFHPSEWSEVIIRNPSTLQVEKDGNQGLIQLLSLVPRSYPGNSILTEDLGTIYGVDSCDCGRKGKYFKVHGRIENSEMRGCSNVIN